VGQLLAQGVAAGQQAYQGAYDKAMRDRMIQEQLAERQQARAEQQAAQALLPQILRPGAQTPTFYGQPTQMPLRDDEGNIMPGAGVSVGQPQIDMNTLQQLLTRAPSVAGKVLPTVEAFRKMTAPQEFDLAEGQVRYRVDPNTGQAMPVAGAAKTPKPTSDIQEYEKAVSQGFKGSLLDYQMAIRQAGATRLNVDTGGRAFEQKAGQFAAETFRDLANQGTTATRSAIQLDRLDTLLGKTGGGLATQAKAIAGNFGIETKNLSEIQAAEAIVNQLVPLQRPPGSGTMSDADLALFKRSLPRLINTPAGNKQIIDTLKAINQYDQQIGAIARDALRGKITPEEADARIMRVPNPLRRTLDEILGG
jgi:flagellar protein FlgJ